MRALLAMFQQRGWHSFKPQILEYRTFASGGLQKPGSGPKAWLQKGKPLMQRGPAGLTPFNP